jgi:hypothetical protein
LIASSQSTLRPRGPEAPEGEAAVQAAPASNANHSAPSPQTIDGIRRFLEADSLGYLSLENLRAAVADTKGNFCSSCFTGSYPTAPVQLEVKHKSQQEDESGGHEQIPQVTVTRDN